MGKNGFVLALILCLFLCLGLLLCSLFLLPGSVRRYTHRVAQEMQELYDAESAIVAHMAKFPQGYFKNLPAVEECRKGPFAEICAEPLHYCAYGLERFRPHSASDWLSAVNSYRKSLQESLLQHPLLERKSGNRRVFKIPQKQNLYVQDGDLVLDGTERVESGLYVVDGNVIVRGSAFFDTLKIFSRGNIFVQGKVRVGYAELSGAEIDLAGESRMRGIFVGQKRIGLSGNAVAEFPSFAVALGFASPEISVTSRALFEGSAVSPGGIVELDGRKNLRGACYPYGTQKMPLVTDSSRAFLPAFFGEQIYVVQSGAVR